MNALLEKAAGFFDRRFILNAFLPVLISAAAALGILGYATGDLARWIRAWNALDGLTQALTTAAALTSIWFLAGVLSSQYRNITQLYEGYPLVRVRWLEPVGDWFVDFHYRRRGTLSKTRIGAEAAYYAYPEGGRDEFLPTSLGNALRGAEYYPKHRYGAPTTFLWPRLYYLAPERFRLDLAQFRTDYEWLLGVSLLSGSLATALGVVQLAIGASPILFAGTFGGGLFLSLCAYRAAVSSAIEYGAQLRAGVDLYRTDVLVRLRWPAPEDAHQEQERWAEVRRVHLAGEPRRSPYAPLPPAETPPQA